MNLYSELMSEIRRSPPLEFSIDPEFDVQAGEAADEDTLVMSDR